MFAEPSSNSSSRGSLTDCFPDLSTESLQWLEKEYTSKEVLEALKAMGPLKALGPDSFQPLLFQRYWNLVGAQVCEAILNVLQGGEIPMGWDWDKFSQHLTPKFLQRIAFFELAHDGEGDSLYWVAHRSSKFNIKSALAIVRGEQNIQPDSDWRWCRNRGFGSYLSSISASTSRMENPPV
ncbi:hypothetical protein Cgig2_013512 [Carnegiea gigantea]|uniref:Uncharacterized protein n=1 Tax=Carnegiea gigantea TaxID=171969 RepID=A0A9Q1JHW3_9CARY|nr:hypothetical protein Cgig2_013512 [Carnegiea gigantea]